MSFEIILFLVLPYEIKLIKLKTVLKIPNSKYKVPKFQENSTFSIFHSLFYNFLPHACFDGKHEWTN